MGNSRFAIKLLKHLESVFPLYDELVKGDLDRMKTEDKRSFEILKKNKLIKEARTPWPKYLKSERTPKELITWEITPKGIEFLNGLRQKRTNNLLLALTVILTIIGLFQIIVHFI